MTFTDFAFVSGFLCAALIACVLLRYAGVSLRAFSIPSFVVLYYLVTAYAGLLPLYFGWDPLRVSMGVVDQGIIVTMFVYTAITLLLMVFGFIFAHQFLRLRAHSARPPVPAVAQTGERAVFVVLLLACLGVLLLYLQKVSSIALFAALRGDIVAAAVARSEMGNAFSGNFWRYQLFFGPLLIMCCLFFYLDGRTSGRGGSQLLFYLALPVAIFASVMAIEKAPFVNLVVALYLAYAVVRGGRYWQPGFKYFAIGMLVALVGIYLTFTGITQASSGIRALVSRVLTGGITPAYFYLELFPARIDYLHGASLPNPADLLPFVHFPLTTEVARWIHPENAALGIVGSAPTVFWAEIYANVGPTGVMLVPFAVGISIYVVQHIFATFVWTPTTVAATIMLASHFKELAGTGISYYLVDTTLLAILVTTILTMALRPLGSLRLTWFRAHRPGMAR